MFTNYKLVIYQEDYKHLPATPGYEAIPFQCSFDEYLEMFQRVGGPWGWDRRPKYHDDIDGLKERFNAATIYSLTHDHEIVGYCMAIPRKDLSIGFGRRVGEIENFGLFNSQTARGHGPALLPLIFSDMFNRYSTVYLESRSTNHPKVVSFYQAQGMHLLASDNHEDDLYPEPLSLQ